VWCCVVSSVGVDSHFSTEGRDPMDDGCLVPSDGDFFFFVGRKEGRMAGVLSVSSVMCVCFPWISLALLCLA